MKSWRQHLDRLEQSITCPVHRDIPLQCPQCQRPKATRPDPFTAVLEAIWQREEDTDDAEAR